MYSEVGVFGTTADSNNITDNNASNNGYEGIHLYSGCDYNTLSNNYASNNSRDGIYLWYSSNNTLMDNTVSNNIRYGIFLEFFSNYNFIEKNSIVRNTTNNDSWSIYVESDAQSNTFKDNTVGSKYPTKISVYDYYESFKIRGVEDPPESPKPPEYPTTGQNISNYMEILNLSANTTLFLDFHYEDKDVKDINEETLKVWKHNGTAWVEGVGDDSWNGTRNLDTENNVVGVEVNEFCIFAPLAGMPVHNINTGEDFTKIQEAIIDDETVDGHTITVDRGYTEAETTENIYVDKELTIKSSSDDPSNTVIEAEDDWEPVIKVIVDEVTIQGFTIKGATHVQGVNVYGGENVDIKNCIVRDNYFGVLLDYEDPWKSTYCTIQNCQFTSNTNGDVYINQSDYNNVFDCTFEDKYGVKIDSGTENCIWDNTFTNNDETAIHVFSGSKNSIKDNVITNAKMGMLVENTEENEICGNKMEDADECGAKLDNSNNNNLVGNEVSSTPTGFFLIDSNDNTIEDCTVSGSVSGAIMGIDLQDSKRNTITGCSIHDLSTIGYSATGIRMFSGATHNKIYHSTISELDATKSEGIDVGSPLNEFYNVTIANVISRGDSSEGKGIDVWAYANGNTFNKVKISDVRAKNNSFGFYLYENNHNKIESCTVTNINADYNNAYAIHLNRSNSTEISNTTLKAINATSNDSAILIEGTDGTNTFDNVTIGTVYPTSFNLTYSGDIEIDEVESAPGDPDGGKNISKYVAVTNNTAARVLLKISYSDSELGDVDENNLKMWRHDGGWAEVPPPNGVNTDENYVYANISEFSVFAPLSVTAPSPCYIATATYGTPLDRRIDVLRDFRDNVLVTNPVGETFVSTYYATSPPIADALRENDGLRTVTRLTLITPLVYLSKIALNGILLVFSIGLAVGLLFRRDRMKILKSLLVGIGSILVFIAAIFSLGSAGHTIPFCAGIGAYLLPFVIPVSVGLTVSAIWKRKGKTIGTV